MTDTQWVYEESFTIKEIAAAIEVPVDTLASWLRSLALMGFPMNAKRGNLRTMSAHAGLTAAILANLQRLGVSCTPQVLVLAHWMTHDGQTPLPPGTPHIGRIPERFCIVEIDLAGIWADLEPRLRAIYDTPTE